jgi:hypothetical protein
MIAEISATLASELRSAFGQSAGEWPRAAAQKKIALSAAGAIRQGENLRF